MMDRLEEMFVMQNNLNKKIANERGILWIENNHGVSDGVYSADGLGEVDISKGINSLVAAMHSELEEVKNEVTWKWWANRKDIDRENLKEELIDVWHFLMTAFLLINCNPEEMYQAYINKNRENIDRQNGNTKRKGYDVNSDEQYQNID